MLRLEEFYNSTSEKGPSRFLYGSEILIRVEAKLARLHSMSASVDGWIERATCATVFYIILFLRNLGQNIGSSIASIVRRFFHTRVI